ncbi:MAG: peptidase and in kexin sedolisin [Actinomycetia bacterium]|nr:peptidase and in kexin sedolisin [Actinomycetes bacterium]
MNHSWLPRAATTALAGLLVAGVGALAPMAPAQAAVKKVSLPWFLAGIGWHDTASTATGTTISAAVDALGGSTLTSAGYDGKGIGIAMIDTGVAPVAGLTGGNVVNGPDLSFESQDPATRYLDRDGHGTHLAGIMVGRRAGDFGGGAAPGAKLTSIKVGSATGAVDVGQVIAGIDWAVAHRSDDPSAKIRIIELAYGTDGVQSPQLDPLAHAVESAWRAGIVVVAAGGNSGGATRLLNPATDPYVIAVGALDTMGTTTLGDDEIADFSSRGDSSRKLDLVVPGRSLLSLRAPGCVADTAFPAARVGSNEFKGSGSSQATALAAGAVALLLDARPTLTPDQVKRLLMRNARPITSTGAADTGIKAMDLRAARADTGSTTAQTWPKSTGLGTLEGARGTVHVSDGTTELRGESDIFGPLSTTNWAAAATNTWAWNTSGQWMGRTMTGSGYAAGASGVSSWSGRAWSGRAWSGRAWSESAWASVAWNGAGWSGSGWN